MSGSQLLAYITPDEQFTWDTKQIADEIPGFEFKGPGWYSKLGSWMLIINTDIADVYTLQVWFDRDPRNGYAAIAEAPVRVHGEVSTEAKPVQYGGLLVLLIGLFLFIPMSAFVLHKWGPAGVAVLLVAAFLFGRLARWVFKRGKKPEEKKT